MKKFKAYILQFFHCLWGTIRLKSCQMCSEQETVDGEETYIKIFCSCEKVFLEHGIRDTPSWDEFDEYKKGSKYDN